MHRNNYDLTVDLHGMRAEAAELLVLQTMRSGANRGKAVAIIHGRGSGVLKNLVRRQLREMGEVDRVWYGEELNLPGLDGVTVAFLRK